MHRHEISESNGACNTHFIFDAVGKKKTSSTVLLRKAAKPSSLPRRSFPQPSSGHGPRVDPRPVSNKAFLNSCARQLMSYLTSHGYDVALSPKTLAAPSTKEFASLALFLFRRADENFKFGSKTEDDVPTFFRQLRYPFQISKCTLFAVGSLHTWPFLLSALTWLVQVYFYEEETKVPKEIRGSPDALFMKCASSAYQHFLSGDDIKCNNMEREFVSTVQQASFEKGTLLRILEQENTELEGLLKLMLKDSEVTSPLYEEKVACANMTSEYIHLTRDLEVSCTDADFQSTHIYKDSLSRKNFCDVLHADLANLQHKLRVLTRLNKHPESDSLACGGAASTQSRRSEFESRIPVLEAEATKTFSEIYEYVLVYNDLVQRIVVFHQHTKYGQGEHMQGEVYMSPHNLDGLANGTCIASSRCILQNTHQNYAQRKWNNERNGISLEQTLQQLQDEHRKRTDQANTLTSSAIRFELRYSTEKKEIADQLAALMSDLTAIEEEAFLMRSSWPNRSVDIESTLSSFQVFCDERQKHRCHHKLAAQNLMLAALDSLMGHKQQVQDLVNIPGSPLDYANSK